MTPKAIKTYRQRNVQVWVDRKMIPALRKKQKAPRSTPLTVLVEVALETYLGKRV